MLPLFSCALWHAWHFAAKSGRTCLSKYSSPLGSAAKPCVADRRAVRAPAANSPGNSHEFITADLSRNSNYIGDFCQAFLSSSRLALPVLAAATGARELIRRTGAPRPDFMRAQLPGPWLAAIGQFAHGQPRRNTELENSAPAFGMQTEYKLDRRIF